MAGHVLLGARQRQRRVAPDDRLVTVRIGMPPRSPRYETPKEYGDTSTSTRSDAAPGQARRQHAGSQRHAKVGMHVLARFETGALDKQAGDQRRAGRTAHQQNRVHVAGLLAGILQRFGHAVERGFHQRADHLFIFVARNLHFEMQRSDRRARPALPREW